MLLQNISAMNSDRINNYVGYIVPNHDLLSSYQAANIEVACLGHSGKRDSIRTLWRFIRLARRLKIDVIHANHLIDRSYASIAGRILRIPVVVTLHDITPREAAAEHIGKRRMSAFTALERFGVRRFVAVSKSVEETYVREYDFPEDKVSLIYSGLGNIGDFIDEDESTKSRLRSELQLEDSFPLIINVARLQPVKGQVQLVPAMKKIVEKWPKAHLLIVGDGPERSKIEQAIKESNFESNITLLGRRDDVPELLNCADLFLFPSFNEALGLSVIEAMAAGLPVVAYNYGGLRELVNNGENGLLVERGDEAALAEAVIKIMCVEGLASEMGMRGRQRVTSEFNASVTASKLESLYESILGRN